MLGLLVFVHVHGVVVAGGGEDGGGAGTPRDGAHGGAVTIVRGRARRQRPGRGVGGCDVDFDPTVVEADCDREWSVGVGRERHRRRRGGEFGKLARGLARVVDDAPNLHLFVPPRCGE